MRFPRFVPFVVCLALNTFPCSRSPPTGTLTAWSLILPVQRSLGQRLWRSTMSPRVQYTTKTNSEGIYVLPSFLRALPTPGFQDRV